MFAFKSSDTSTATNRLPFHVSASALGRYPYRSIGIPAERAHLVSGQSIARCEGRDRPILHPRQPFSSSHPQRPIACCQQAPHVSAGDGRLRMLVQNHKGNPVEPHQPGLRTQPDEAIVRLSQRMHAVLRQTVFHHPRLASIFRQRRRRLQRGDLMRNPENCHGQTHQAIERPTLSGNSRVGLCFDQSHGARINISNSSRSNGSRSSHTNSTGWELPRTTGLAGSRKSISPPNDGACGHSMDARQRTVAPLRCSCLLNCQYITAKYSRVAPLRTPPDSFGACPEHPKQFRFQIRLKPSPFRIPARDLRVQTTAFVAFPPCVTQPKIR